MKKKQLLCGTLSAGALVMTGCSSNEDFEVLNRDYFAENVFAKDSSQFIQFDFNSLTEKQTTELESFRKLSKLQEAISNGDIMSLNLNQISDDEESNQIIDNTISEAPVDESADCTKYYKINIL